MIHPSAIIDPKAELAADVSVGPFALIEGNVRIGAGSKVLAHAVVTGDVTIGEGNTIGYGAIIGAPPQDLAFKPETKSSVVIGDRNTFREYCTVHRGTGEGSMTTVGNDNFLMAGTHLAHNVQIGSRVIFANNVLVAGHVTIEDRVFVGGGSVFHQFIRVGQLAVVQGISGFSKNIPPFTIAADKNMVAGLNVVGLRRAGVNPAQRLEIREAYKLLYRSGFNVKQALEKATEREWGEYAQTFFEFVRNSTKRGICAAVDSGADGEQE